MHTVILLLFLLAVVLTALRGAGVPSGRVHLGWIGVAAALVALLLAGLPA